MKADIYKLLLQSHADGDGKRRSEKRRCNSLPLKVMRAIFASPMRFRTIISKMPATSARKAASVVDIAAPRGELADLLEGGHREERLRDIILRPDTRDLLLRIISENRARGRLERFGVSPRRRLFPVPWCSWMWEDSSRRRSGGR